MARAQGIIVGLGASWIKALTEPRLQSIAERILPSSPAQKQQVGADADGRPENLPPAVLANRTAVVLGHDGLTARQRLRVQPRQDVLVTGCRAGENSTRSAG
jgi:hypothetical protein